MAKGYRYKATALASNCSGVLSSSWGGLAPPVRALRRADAWASDTGWQAGGDGRQRCRLHRLQRRGGSLCRLGAEAGDMVAHAFTVEHVHVRFRSCVLVKCVLGASMSTGGRSTRRLRAHN